MPGYRAAMRLLECRQNALSWKPPAWLRGRRLWIHAAAKWPNRQTIESVQQQYDALGEHAPFPQTYPTSALLGWVDVAGAMSQPAYGAAVAGGVLSVGDGQPMEPSESAHVMLCHRPARLAIAMSMAGRHKLWKLDGDAWRSTRAAKAVPMWHMARVCAAKDGH